MLVAERVADGAHPLAHAQRAGIAKRGDRQTSLAIHLDQRDVGVRIRTDDARTQRAAVGKLDRNPLGAIDHVIVGQDAAVGIDDEAAARPAPRCVTPSAVGPVEGIGRIRADSAAPPRLPAPRRRVDIHDRRIDPFDHIGKIHQARRSRRRSTGMDGRSNRSHSRRRGSGGDGRMRGSAGDNRADKKGDDGGQRKRDDGEPFRHYPVIIRRRNASSSRTSTPSSRAFSSLLPASAPATT